MAVAPAKSVGASHIFGFHTKSTYFKHTPYTSSEAPPWFLNILRIIDYIPVLSFFSSYCHYHMADDFSLSSPSAENALKVRCVVAAFGLGSLFFLPDLFVTMKRFCCCG